MDKESVSSISSCNVSTLSSLSTDSSDASDDTTCDVSVKPLESENVRPVLRQLQNVAAPERTSSSPMNKRLDSGGDPETSSKENAPPGPSDTTLSGEPQGTPLEQKTDSSSPKASTSSGKT